MDFDHSPTAQALQRQLGAFMARYVLPHNAAWHQAVQQGEYPPPFLEDLKTLAREEGLWNLFLPTLGDDEPGTRLTNLDCAPLAETMGRLPWASEVFNCSAPDTGNMELLHRFAKPAQRAQWLTPLLNGEMRSAFAMSEPDVASSDATNLQTTVREDGDALVLDGRKWFITGAAHPNCQLLIVMARNATAQTEADHAPDKHHGHSLVLLPIGTPGIEVVRNIPVVQHHAPEGHGEIVFRQVRVPGDQLLGTWGDGFAMAQARLGPGRVHHAMRTIGQCELALELASERALERESFGRHLCDCANVQEWLARSRIEIDQARLLRSGSPAGAALRVAAGPRATQRCRQRARASGRHQGGGRGLANPGDGPRDADLRRHGFVARHTAGLLLDLGPCAAPDGRPRQGAPAQRGTP